MIVAYALEEDAVKKGRGAMESPARVDRGADEGNSKMRKLLWALAALSLTACGSFGADPTAGPNASVSTVQTKAGQTLVVAWKAFDALLTAVDGLQAAGVLRAGTPKAIRVADLLDRGRNALNAATAAVHAGNATSFSAALADAQKALEDAKAAIGGA